MYITPIQDCVHVWLNFLQIHSKTQSEDDHMYHRSHTMNTNVQLYNTALQAKVLAQRKQKHFRLSAILLIKLYGAKKQKLIL